MLLSARIQAVFYLYELILALCLLNPQLSFAGQKMRFCREWKFFRGDVTGGAQGVDYNDNSWETVYLPHTVREELNYRTSSIYMGVCWYRKTFTPSPSLRGKKVYIEFEAAMQTSQVWVNGNSLITHLGGYTPFVLDITDFLRFGSSNVIAVRLDNNASTSFPPGNPDPDFLYFGGLYRDVYLHVMDSVHITHPILANVPASGGVFVTYPSVSSASAVVSVKTHVANERKCGCLCSVTTTIIDSDGKSVASNSTAATEIGPQSSYTFTQSITVSNPRLWSPKSPNLYTIMSQVFVNGGSDPIDTISTPIGIRSIAFSKADGLRINGTRYRLHGCNRHMSYPYIGNAVPRSGQYRDAVRIKEFGFDFVRMSHYMQPESFVEACDRLGIASMACLPGWQYFSDNQAFRSNSIKALRDMIRVYRNHPSVILYEAMHNESMPSAAYLREAQAAAHEEYPGNQLFTCGEEENGILDVYISSAQHNVRNYSGSRPCVISEYGDWEHGCVWNETGPITGCQCRIERSAGQSALNAMRSTRAGDVKTNENCSWFTVDGVWTVFDYQSWSRFPYTSSGDMDIFRIPKYSSYASSSQIPLFTELTTPSSGIKLIIDTAGLPFKADGSDIAIVYAANINGEVRFSVSGPAALVGKNPVEAVSGIASILLRAGTTEGRITVTAAAGSLSASADVTSHPEADQTVEVVERSSGPRTKSLMVENLILCRTREGVSVRIVPASEQAPPLMKLTLFDAQGRAVASCNPSRNGRADYIRSLTRGIYFGRLDCGHVSIIRSTVW